MILREYLYVDVAAVRGILAQLEFGIVETESTKDDSEKRTRGGVRGFAEHAQSITRGLVTEKSLGDALFPRMEEALESDGLLDDVSELLRAAQVWNDDDLAKELPPGKIVRITAPGYLMDSRFMASVLSGFSVTHRGLVHMGVFPESPRTTPPPKSKAKGSTRGNQGQKPPTYRDLPFEDESLEARIPKGKMSFGESDDGEIRGEFLRGIIQVLRGMYTPGLHLSMVPNVHSGGAITLRLQEGRQFLDSDPDVLFSRYGVGEQEWTVVGTIGHHAKPSPDMGIADFADGDVIRRERLAQYVTGLATTFGNLGFTDLAQAPGFSVVPWAVYRTLGSYGGELAASSAPSPG